MNLHRWWHGPADFRAAAVPSGIGATTDVLRTWPRGRSKSELHPVEALEQAQDWNARPPAAQTHVHSIFTKSADVFASGVGPGC